jgi:hypothetical protein
LVVSLSDDHCIRRIHNDGRMETILGVADGGVALFGGVVPAIPEEKVRSTPVWQPAGLLERHDGSLLYIERGYQLVRQYIPGHGIRSIFPTDPLIKRTWGGRRDAPDKVAISAYCPVYPTALAENAQGQLFLADAHHRCVWQMDLERGILTKVMSSPAGSRGSGGPAALACGFDGTLWVLDYGEGRISGYTQSASGWQRVVASCSTIYESVLCSASEGSGLVCAQ